PIKTFAKVLRICLEAFTVACCQALRRPCSSTCSGFARWMVFLVSANCSGRSPLGALGKHAKKRLPFVAAPTLFGVAAAFVMSAPPAGAATKHTADVQKSSASTAQANLPKLLADVRTA